MVVSWSSLKVFGTKASEETLLLRKESFAARQVKASRASLRSSMPELPENLNEKHFDDLLFCMLMLRFTIFFGKSVKPIPSSGGGADYAPHVSTCRPPRFLDLKPSLN